MSTRHTDTTDIREWLRTNRPDLGVQPRGQVKKADVQAYYEANPDKRPPEPEVEQGPELSGEEPDSEADKPDNGERPPEQQGRRSKWRGIPPRSERPRPSRRRVPLDGLLSAAWAGLGKVASNDQTLPVGRCMEMQAPAAGMILDEAVRGSLVDRMAQPFARGAKRMELVWAVAGPPMLCAAVVNNPGMYEVIRPMLIEAVKSWIVLSGPKIRRARERERKLMQEMAELGGIEMPDGQVLTVEQLVDQLFAPPPEHVTVVTDAQPSRAAA